MTESFSCRLLQGTNDEHTSAFWPDDNGRHARRMVCVGAEAVRQEHVGVGRALVAHVECSDELADGCVEIGLGSKARVDDGWLGNAREDVEKKRRRVEDEVRERRRGESRAKDRREGARGTGARREAREQPSSAGKTTRAGSEAC